MIVGAWWAYYEHVFIDNFAVVTAGELCRSPQPRGSDWGLLRRSGIVTVVNLRGEVEDPGDLAATRRACVEIGATMVHIPVEGELPGAGQVEDFLGRVAFRSGPILVHCHHGEDRTGVMVAAYRVAVQGWSVTKALREMARLRGRLSEEKRRRVEGLLARVRRRAGRELPRPGRAAGDKLD